MQTGELSIGIGQSEVKKKDRNINLGRSLAVQWLGLGTSTAVAWVQPLFRELRSR